MTRKNKGMSPYNPKPKTGYGCHSCIHTLTECTRKCIPNQRGGTGYEFNKVYNFKMFWLRKERMKNEVK